MPFSLWSSSAVGTLVASTRCPANFPHRSVGAARACGIGAGLVEFLQRFGIQLQIGGTEQLMELIEICRAGNRSGNARLRQQPGQGYLGRRRAVSFRHLVERAQDSETALVQIFL